MTRSSRETDAELQRLVQRYLDNVASLPERRHIERLMAADPRYADYVRRFAAVWDAVGTAPDSIDNPDTPSAWTALAARIRAADRADAAFADTALANAATANAATANAAIANAAMANAAMANAAMTDAARADAALGSHLAQPPAPADRPPRRTAPLIRPAWIAAAAAAVVVVAGLTPIYYRTELAPRRALAMRDAVSAADTAPASSQLVSTLRGQRLSFWLPDGSRLVLGPASRLRYDVAADSVAAHPSHLRQVWLSGEAVFRVVHHADRPFVVHAANGLTAEDLGTTFVVESYPREPTRVAVDSGLVALHVGGTVATEITPGRVGTLAADHRTVAVGPADRGHFFGWTDGALRYSEAPLTDVAAGLGRAYDLDIRITDAAVIGRRVVNFAIDGETADQALDVLVRALPGVQYDRHGRVVTLFRR
jgi:ferric-dicitrate binding protein FerR (iron transport regulator)